MIRIPHSAVAQLAQGQQQNAGLALASCRPRQVVNQFSDSNSGLGRSPLLKSGAASNRAVLAQHQASPNHQADADQRNVESVRRRRASQAFLGAQ